jgi:hypothetical protein
MSKANVRTYTAPDTLLRSMPVGVFHEVMWERYMADLQEKHLAVVGDAVLDVQPSLFDDHTDYTFRSKVRKITKS